MVRLFLVVFVACLAALPGSIRGQSAPDAGTTGGEAEASDAGASGAQSATPDAGGGTEADAGSNGADAGPPDRIPEVGFVSLLGTSWGGRRGCAGEWQGKWKVAGGGFSLVVGGSTSGASDRAFHAVCTQFTGYGAYGAPKVGVTLFGGTIHGIAIITGAGSESDKARIEAYFDQVCESTREASGGVPYDTVYESCGGYEVGMSDGDGDLSMSFFTDESAFRSRMQSLPMPNGGG